MEGASFRSKALNFALCAGAVAFILALLAGADSGSSPQDFARALVVALVCGVMSWGSAERAIAGTATAIDRLADRLAAAAAGDLTSPADPCVEEALPDVAVAMDGMFGKMRERLDSMNALALFDPLTSLPNRTNFRAAVEAELARLGEEERAALLFVDLDGFKGVNDTLGHAFGDELLRLVADRLRAARDAERRRGDHDEHELVIARLAGDEFIFFVSGLRGEGEGAEIADRLLAVLDAPFVIDGQQLDVGASVGVALFPDHGGELTLLMRAADVAMYRAKSLGRRRVEVFSSGLAARDRARKTMEEDLRLALDRDELDLVFQPQFDLRDGRITALEALLRWRHPRDGLQLPSQFFRIAEETGLIGPLCEWAMCEAIAALGRWRAAGFEQRLTLNVGARQIEEMHFATMLRRACERASLPLSAVEIEINEVVATAVGYGGPVLEAIAGLRAEGMTVAIDDFGSGYSSLGRLGLLPVDRLKLDPSIVRDIAVSAPARAVASAVVAMAHGLGLGVVAEGVEEKAQLDVLRVIGCEAGQGHALAEPIGESLLVGLLCGERLAAAG